MRTPAQSRRMANADLKVMLGLLDARTVVGDQTLLAGLRASALSDWRARAAERLGSCVNSSRPGAPRSASWPTAGAGCQGQPGWSAGCGDHARHRRVIGHRRAAGRLAEPYQLLLDVRDALHTTTGRSSDKLLRQEQPAIAMMLGIDDPRGDGDGCCAPCQAPGAPSTGPLMWCGTGWIGCAARPGCRACAGAVCPTGCRPPALPWRRVRWCPTARSCWPVTPARGAIRGSSCAWRRRPPERACASRPPPSGIWPRRPGRCRFRGPTPCATTSSV